MPLSLPNQLPFLWKFKLYFPGSNLLVPVFLTIPSALSVPSATIYWPSTAPLLSETLFKHHYGSFEYILLVSCDLRSPAHGPLIHNQLIFVLILKLNILGSQLVIPLILATPLFYQYLLEPTRALFIPITYQNSVIPMKSPLQRILHWVFSQNLGEGEVVEFGDVGWGCMRPVELGGGWVRFGEVG